MKPMPGPSPEMAEMLAGGPPDSELPSAPGESLETPTAGAEAAAQSGVAKDGLAAFAHVQALNGARPEASDLKAMLTYVLTEGLQAPQANEMVALLQKFGITIPGVNSNGSDVME